MIEAALAQSNGRVSGASGAAAKLGIPRQTLEAKILSWESTSSALGPDKRP
jgi:DNA-binding NtrC family response regulator